MDIHEQTVLTTEDARLSSRDRSDDLGLPVVVLVTLVELIVTPFVEDVVDVVLGVD